MPLIDLRKFDHRMKSDRSKSANDSNSISLNFVLADRFRLLHKNRTNSLLIQLGDECRATDIATRKQLQSSMSLLPDLLARPIKLTRSKIKELDSSFLLVNIQILSLNLIKKKKKMLLYFIGVDLNF